MPAGRWLYVFILLFPIFLPERTGNLEKTVNAGNDWRGADLASGLTFRDIHHSPDLAKKLSQQAAPANGPSSSYRLWWIPLPHNDGGGRISEKSCRTILRPGSFPEAACYRGIRQILDQQAKMVRPHFDWA